MNQQANPYSALDKVLLSSSQANKAGQVQNEPNLHRDQLEKQPSSPTGQKAPSQISEQESNRDTVTPRHHDTTVSSLKEETIDKVRKAVRQLGKEAATHRFTPEEKSAIAEVVYTYKQKGIKTSENEITRIAINYLMADYRENGASSILARILDRLNA